jgi:hypothetical protein
MSSCNDGTVDHDPYFVCSRNELVQTRCTVLYSAHKSAQIHNARNDVS